MTEWLLLANTVLLVTGAAIYFGTMLTVKVFLAPSWGSLTPDNIDDQFVRPVEAATRFFMVMIPLMLVLAVVVVVAEWGEWSRVTPAAVCAAGIVASTYVFRALIHPINKRILDGDYDGGPGLAAMLDRWLVLNDLRFVAAIAMWGSALWYVVAAGGLPEGLA